jgi:SAM-dependent methyltransferase
MTQKAGFLSLFKRTPRQQNAPDNAPLQDDFDWRDYPRIYSEELAEISQKRLQRLSTGDYTYAGGTLAKARQELKALHPNHRLLYETILQLRPASVVELGCGGGDHAHNIKLLYPECEVNGYDLSDSQLALLRKRNDDLDPSRFRQMDLTLPAPQSCQTHDIAYTQAVIMHIQTGNGHRVALSNAFRLATKQVVLMEHWLKHDFMDDIQKLHQAGVIGWNKLHFHYRCAPEWSNSPHLMVVSSSALPQYPVLTDYALLTGPIRQRPQ